jgi:hypothetical protein
MLFNRKGEMGLLIILVIIIVLFFFGWLINVSQRECRTNRDCGSESYCGSDFSCHQYPTIQKTVVQYDLAPAAVIIGLALIFAAIIFRKQPNHETVHVEKAEIKEPREVDDISEPYYKSDSNIRTP